MAVDAVDMAKPGPGADIKYTALNRVKITPESSLVYGAIAVVLHQTITVMLLDGRKKAGARCFGQMY